LVAVAGAIFFFASEAQTTDDEIRPVQLVSILGNAMDVVEPGASDHEAYFAVEQAAIRKAELVRFTSLSDAISADISRMASTIRECNTLASDIKTDQRGQCIAADEKLVTQCVALLADEHITQTEYEALQTQHTSLSDALAAAESVATAPSEKVFSLLERLQQDVDQVLQPLDAKYAGLRNLIAFAATNEPSDRSLQSAMDEFNRNQSQKQLEELAAQAEVLHQRDTQTRVEAQQKEADLKLAVQKQKDANRHAALVAENDRLKKEGKRDAARKIQEQQKAAALAEFKRNLPAIRQYLGAFIKPGHKLRGPQYSIEAGPASLSVLRSKGVLANDQQGMLALIKATGNYYNDRSHHRFDSDIRYLHPDKWHKADMTLLNKMHELLRKFGPIMVEQGLLSS